METHMAKTARHQRIQKLALIATANRDSPISRTVVVAAMMILLPSLGR